ncbi:MAG: galactofuranose ABC transporter, permease protein YjfF [Clostridiales bacterium]
MKIYNHISRKKISFPLTLSITITLFLLLFAIGSIRYTGFFSVQVFFDLFIDNSHLIVMAVGMTFVLLIGGIDISVGSVLAFTGMLSAYLIEKVSMNPILAIFIVLTIGTLYGLFQGSLINYFEMQPFIVTLAGLFFARGMTNVISIETIDIKNSLFVKISEGQINIFGGHFSYNVIISILVLIIGIYILRYTKFGRSVYAIGGNEQSAKLMGLKVDKTKVFVYGISGFCAALGGIMYSIYSTSGYNLAGVGMELDVIAAVVIGGTLLTGGVGYVFGSLFGVLILGVILSIINFEGTLSSWWTRIAVGILLFFFILLQRILSIKKINGDGIFSIIKRLGIIKGFFKGD